MPDVDHLPRAVVTIAEVLVLHPDTGDVLVIRKADHHALPAGGVEDGESFAAAAIRETYEETGIEVELAGLAAVTERWVRGRVELFFTFWGRYLRGEPEVIADQAVEEAMWVPAGDVDALLPWFECSIAGLVDDRRAVDYFHLVE